MLLSLRLIPVHLKTTDLDGTQSMGSSQYHVSCFTRSSQDDLGPEVAGDDVLADDRAHVLCPIAETQNTTPPYRMNPLALPMGQTGTPYQDPISNQRMTIY